MTDILVKDLVKSFEIGKNVLDGLSFSVTQGERVGILGRNGCGKTTLFKILAGEMDYDDGEIQLAKGKRLGLMSQIPVYPEGWTTEDVLETAFKRLHDIETRIEEVLELIEAEPSPGLLHEYDGLLEDFRRLGGFEAQTELNRVANGLEINAELRGRSFDSLSGGEKTRVNLARLILEDTEILLLDEPTNHLDLRATEWLEDYMLNFKGTVLAVSHDRYFLDKVIKRCIDISEGKAEFFSGNYSFYVVERQRRFEEKLKQYEKDSAKIAQLTRAAEQMHLWAFMGMDKLHKRAFSMEKRIEKLKKTEKPTQQRRLKAKFKELEFLGDEVIVMEDLSKGYGERLLFEGLSLTVIGGERIAIIGDNGSGKSTLIKIIMDLEKPDSGYIYRRPQVRAAYLPQIVTFGSESRSALDSMLYDCKCQPQEARDRLAAFGFRGESVMTPVGAMSGGERSRLKLCMLMGSDINLLLLDEPTNHLDIASREWMEDALADYEQTLLFVSHDRFLIDRFATRVLSIENGSVTDFPGSYSRFREWQERQAIYAKQQSEREKEADREIEINREDGGGRRCARTSSKEKQARRIQREIERAEAELSRLEAECAANASDYLRLMELEEQRAPLEEILLELYEQWEEVIL